MGIYTKLPEEIRQVDVIVAGGKCFVSQHSPLTPTNLLDIQEALQDVSLLLDSRRLTQSSPYWSLSRA